MTVYNQSNTDFTFADNSDNTVNGNDDVITDGYPATLAVDGYKNTINAYYDTLAMSGDSGLGNTIDGSGNQISVADNSHVSIYGGGNRIQQSNGFVTLGGSNAWADTLTGTSIGATVLADSHVYLDASVVSMNLGADCLVIATGDNTNFFGSDDRIHTSQATSGGDAVTGNNNHVFVAAGSLMGLYGDQSVMYADDNSSMALTGNDDRVVGTGYFLTSTAGSEMWIGGNGVSGAQDTLTASKVSVQVGANSNAVIFGDDDTVAQRLDSNLTLVGTGNNVHVGNHADLRINVYDGSGETGALSVLTGGVFNVIVATSANVELDSYEATATLVDNVALAVEMSGNVIHAGGTDTIAIRGGVSNQVFLGVGDVVTDGGYASTFDVSGNVGATTIKNFGHVAIVDLLNGAGGYSSAQDAYASLKSDGNGGLTLSLGADGSIDFTGATGLSAANFKIG